MPGSVQFRSVVSEEGHCRLQNGCVDQFLRGVYYIHIQSYTYIHLYTSIYYIHLYATYIYMLYTSILYTPYYILYSLTNHRKLLQIISGEHEVCVVHWPCSDRPYSDGKVIRNHQSWPMECGGDSPFCGH
jgi:hypothetical protein